MACLLLEFRACGFGAICDLRSLAYWMYYEVLPKMGPSQNQKLVFHRTFGGFSSIALCKIVVSRTQVDKENAGVHIRFASIGYSGELG